MTAGLWREETALDRSLFERAIPRLSSQPPRPSRRSTRHRMLLDSSSLKRPARLPAVANTGSSDSSDTMAALERDVGKLQIHDGRPRAQVVLACGDASTAGENQRPAALRELREAMAKRSPTSVFPTGSATTLHDTMTTYQPDASKAGIDDLLRDMSKQRQETAALCLKSKMLLQRVAQVLEDTKIMHQEATNLIKQAAALHDDNVRNRQALTELAARQEAEFGRL